MELLYLSVDEKKRLTVSILTKHGVVMRVFRGKDPISTIADWVNRIDHGKGFEPAALANLPVATDRIQ